MTRLKRSRAKTEPELLPEHTLNDTDRRHIAERQAAKVRRAAMDEADALSPRLIGVMEGLCDEIRALRITTERSLTESGDHHYEMLGAIRDMTAATHQMTTAAREMGAELAGLRMQRAHGGNGHAKDDNLTDDHSEGKNR